ncbi:type I-F CRISPR-associated protein Csy1 [Massilia sp. W12]|uniref:type I-F CRISPR-associated protein Csy1 n=1 Tax=Massilia sp. W12 TaxID=3126507 RepID=UPI0030D27D48
MQHTIRAFLAGRLAGKLEKLEKEAEKAQTDSPDQAHLIHADFLQKKTALEDAHRPAAWLNDAAQRAGQIAFVTHGAKFTHSDAKAANIYAPQQVHCGYVCTGTLAQIEADVAGNAAALDVAALLQLQADGRSLAQMLEAGDASALAPFAQDPQQLADWLNGFQQVFRAKEIRSHTLMRQVYFPLENGEYHLLGPMFSSVLAQSLHERINEQRFSEAAKEIRKARRENKACAYPDIYFPDLAAMKFGGTKPQNISMGNSKRGGRAYLLSCRPPDWHNTKLPSFQTSDAFWFAWERHNGFFANNTARKLKRLLHEKKTAASNMKIREFRRELVEELVDALLLYAMSLQDMRELAGWSASSALPRAEQLWLDPFRAQTDEAFLQERDADDWREKIYRRFARWLNDKISSDDLPMGDDELKQWKRDLKRAKARLRADLRYDDMREAI